MSQLRPTRADQGLDLSAQGDSMLGAANVAPLKISGVSGLKCSGTMTGCCFKEIGLLVSELFTTICLRVLNCSCTFLLALFASSRVFVVGLTGGFEVRCGLRVSNGALVA